MSDEKTQSPGENPFQANVAETETVSPAQEESSVATQSQENTKPDLDEAAFLAELEEAEKEDPGDTDGGFFWVFRRIVLEIFKVVLILGIIGLVVWFIWGGLQGGGSSSDGKKNPPAEVQESIKTETREENKDLDPKKDSDQPGIGERVKDLIPKLGQKEKEKEKEKEATKEKIKTAPQDDPITPVETKEPETVPVSLGDLYIIVGDAEFLAFQEYRAGQNLAEQTMAWLRTTRQFSEVGVNEVVQYANPVERGEKIEQKIQEGDRLLEEAKRLKSALSQEVAFWTQKNNQDTAVTQKINSEYKAILQNIDVRQLNPKLEELTEARRKIAESQTYLSAYSSLLKNVQNFERLLKSKVIPVYRPSAPEEEPSE